MDICRKRHDEFFKTQFEQTDEVERARDEKRYISDLLSKNLKRLVFLTLVDLITKHVAQIDNKIKKTQVKMDAPEDIVMENIPVEFREKIEGIDIEIKRLLSYVEQLGEMGKIEESEKMTDEIDRLKRTKEDLIILAENPNLAAKQMKVCEICGAMQAINDTEVRNQNHLEGKVHKGFAFLRNEIKRLTKRKEMLTLILQNNKPSRDSGSLKRRTRSKSKDRRDRHTRDRHRKRNRKSRYSHRSRSRDRDRKRHKKHRKKDKAKRKHRKRHRSDSNDSESRSKSKDRDRKHRKRRAKSPKSKSKDRESSSMESGELKR